jgi:putative membrane protein
MEILTQYYFTLKALHLIAVICWMAGLFYLPRLFVYHCSAKSGSEMYTTFTLMEYRLLKYIMNPSMIAVFAFGILLIFINGFSTLGGWFHLKLVLVLALAGMHGLLSRQQKNFANNRNNKSATYYRIINEIPPVLMAIIVILAVVKPF